MHIRVCACVQPGWRFGRSGKTYVPRPHRETIHTYDSGHVFTKLPTVRNGGGGDDTRVYIHHVPKSL